MRRPSVWPDVFSNFSFYWCHLKNFNDKEFTLHMSRPFTIKLLFLLCYIYSRGSFVIFSLCVLYYYLFVFCCSFVEWSHFGYIFWSKHILPSIVPTFLIKCVRYVVKTLPLVYHAVTLRTTSVTKHTHRTRSALWATFRSVSTWTCYRERNTIRKQ